MRARSASVELADPADFLSHLDFALPEDRVARVPSPERENARMLVIHRSSESFQHAHVSRISEWLKAGDLLVRNSARVDPVRVLWRDPKGRQQEILLLRPLADDGASSRWEAIVSGKRLRLLEAYALPGGRTFQLQKRNSGALTEISLDAGVERVRGWMEEHGRPPVPPYIRKERSKHGESEDLPMDPERYQTVFARQGGAVAAPTAGLHFSKALLEEIERKGVQIVDIHLSVGWGTFQPVSAEAWESGRLHPEDVSIPRETAEALLSAISENRRVVAVGTTVVRALEWWHRKGRPRCGLKGSCDLFLRAPWSPAVVGALLTNFHLPRSSLIALVAAFIGPEGEKKILHLYQEAIQAGYRFFSFGDCMLIL